jgi:hypothetical protein
MSESKMSPRKVLAAQRRRQAMKMRMEGATFAAIGQALGISEVAAWRHVQKGLARLNDRMAIDADKLRRETVEQIEALLAAHMPLALGGDTKSANVCSRLLDQRARLYCLIGSTKEAAAANPYENLSREALIGEARRLGLYHDDPFTASDHYQARPSANGHSPMDWPRRHNDGSLAPR